MRTFVVVMINPLDLIQVKAFARIDGLLLSVTWMASMACLMFRPESSWGFLLMLCTPFFVGWRLSEFRNKVLDGAISFRRALCFSCYVFFYASLIFALAQYIYFRYIDNGEFMSWMGAAVNLLAEAYKQQGIEVADIKEQTELIAQIGPVNLTFMFMMQNLMYGAMLSVIIAVIGKKKRKE